MIAIVDYKAGNLRSVQRALGYLGYESVVTSEADEILEAERVIFPGVGAAERAMQSISSHGLDRVIRRIVDAGTPFLGICMGCQIILDRSEEGDTACMGIIPGVVRRFPAMGLKIPHMGWNTLSVRYDHPVLEGIDPGAGFYFVHSFYPDPDSQCNVVAVSSYGLDFAAVIAKNNVVATQFHPEKSGRVGLKLLNNFCSWKGSGY
ncbi:MAG: imidazole glycerol phosphate synthase subunit HisH [Thermodesulfobacteriota bacterium]|nr:imidazole glycerol phosphate synthase subunit HisH [Thermodesulfobacteriota bacterium]